MSVVNRVNSFNPDSWVIIQRHVRFEINFKKVLKYHNLTEKY